MAFSSGILAAGFCYSYHVTNWFWYGIFTFLSTIAVYNGQRLFKAQSRYITPWLTWVRRNEKAIVTGTLLSLFGAGLVFLKIWSLSWLSLTVLCVSMLISILYVVKVKGRNMRELPYLKIHLIAITWSVVIFVFPVLNEKIEVNLFSVFLAHYCYVLAVTIPFDVRDLKYDDKRHKTIPQTVGINASKTLSVVLLIIFTLLMFCLLQGLKTNILFIIAIVTQIMLVVFMNEQRSDLYCAGYIDGAISLLGISYFFIN